jgi:cellulose synthase/poly-beta-1,6-N-acetylglucosamine synthase-like glycosyltransferase
LITKLLLAAGGFNEGYVKTAQSAATQTTFPTANLAIRRELLVQLGGFDERCVTGEDLDLSIKVARSGRRIFYERRAKIRHRFRTTLPELLRQYFNYYRFHPYVLKKHAKRKELELFFADPGRRRWISWRVPMPVHVVIAPTTFSVMYLAMILALAAYGLDAPDVALACAAVATIVGLTHCFRAFQYRRPLESAKFLVIRHLLNWACVLGGLIGGIREGVLYLGTTRERNPRCDP